MDARFIFLPYASSWTPAYFYPLARTRAMATRVPIPPILCLHAHAMTDVSDAVGCGSALPLAGHAIMLLMINMPCTILKVRRRPPRRAPGLVVASAPALVSGRIYDHTFYPVRPEEGV